MNCAFKSKKPVIDDPELAKEFEKKTKAIKSMPERHPDGKYHQRKPTIPRV